MDYEIIVMVEIKLDHPTAPPDTRIFRRVGLLRYLAERGWDEDKLADMNDLIDRGGVIASGPNLSFHVHSLDVHQRNKISTSKGQKGPGRPKANGAMKEAA